MTSLTVQVEGERAPWTFSVMNGSDLADRTLPTQMPPGIAQKQGRIHVVQPRFIFRID